MRKLVACSLFISMLLLPGCAKVMDVARAMDLFADSFQASTIQAHDAHLIANADYINILQTLDAVREASGKLKAIGKDIDELTPEERMDVVNILAIVGYELSADRFEFIDDIGDERIRKGMTIALETVKAALLTAELVLIFKTKEK